MTIFEKHLNLGHKVTIDGEEFTIYGLGLEDAVEIFRLQKIMIPLYNKYSREGKSTGLEMFAEFPEEAVKQAAVLIDKTLKLSYPEEKEEDRKRFASKYFWELFVAVMEANSPEVTDKYRKLQALQDAKPIR